MTAAISATTVVAGVAGDPVRHSLSPLIHNAWIRESGLDAVYVAFEPKADGFARFALGLRGGVIRGLNVTAPFKEAALALADRASERSRRAGSANLLVFETDGAILADNTDGEGLLDAFRSQLGGFDPAAGPAVILGAGGAARGAAAALLEAGAPEVRLVNRSLQRAEALASGFGDRARPFAADDIANALAGARAVINATPLGLNGGEGPDLPFESAPPGCVVMDMVYRPVRTRLLERAAAAGLPTVDGLGMLIGQAAPSFAALFGRPPPRLDIRSLVAAALERPP